MVIVFALLAALSNAVNEATQRIASIAAPHRTSGWRLVLYLFRSPLWLFGWVALIAAFVFQALALNKGQLSIVQPVLATELVFMLVLRRVWIGQSIRPVTWWAAGVTCVGLTGFTAAGQPGGGQPTPASQHWFTSGLACCAAAAVRMAAERSRPLANVRTHPPCLTNSISVRSHNAASPAPSEQSIPASAASTPMTRYMAPVSM